VIILLLGAQVISEFDRRRYEAGGNRYGPSRQDRQPSK
jgi:hypothetical protein